MIESGCGDGRICLTASKRYGCQSVGCEIESRLVEAFRHNIINQNLQHLVVAVEGNMAFLMSLSHCNIACH
jgi:tRNA1(Val) A37 N6-methylase TrmN6